MSRLAPQHYAAALLRLAEEAGSETALAAVDRLSDELVAAGRAAWLPRILAAVEAQVRRKEGVVEARVETPVPLEAEVKAALARSLGVAAGQLFLDERVDPAVLAGLRVQARDRIAADTVKDRVERLFQK